MSPTQRRNLWILAGAVVVIALVAHHNISQDDIILFCVIVPSIILHEISHGYVARIFGDDTAKRAGRLSLNPLVHIDPVGTLLVPALLALGGFAVFGWAKPVPVNTARLRSPRNQAVLVSLAGPLTNIVLAVVTAEIFIHVIRPSLTGFSLPLGAQIVFYFSLVNIYLAVFNLIPLPPLDGSVLFERLLPSRYWPTYLRIRPYTMMIIFGLVMLNFLFNPGPITIAFQHLENWWAGRLGLAV